MYDRTNSSSIGTLGRIGNEYQKREGGDESRTRMKARRHYQTMLRKNTTEKM